MFVRRDFQITNAALGEELRSKDGRSVIKVTHSPIPLYPEDDSDDEYDSDMVIGSDEEDDDEEDDEEKAEGAEGAEDEDDDEEDDEDEDSDYDELENQETSVLCSLTAGKTEQATLNLTFVEGEVVIFEVTGEK